jgi:hypothetical protein
MQKRILASLSWKAAAAIAAGTLAVGTGAATSFSLIGDSHADTDHELKVDEHAKTTTTSSTSTTSTTSTTIDDVEAESHVAGEHETDHPDNFGAIVSKDAHDGGVDGQEISDMAHDRNDARATAGEHATADDEVDDDEHGQREAHDESGDHRRDDVNDDEDD